MKEGVTWLELGNTADLTEYQVDSMNWTPMNRRISKDERELRRVTIRPSSIDFVSSFVEEFFEECVPMYDGRGWRRES